MTKDEIKQTYSMRDILTRCGLRQPNRAGFIECPFHRGDHEPSMKIYDKDYNCFACGANGDIFTFLEQFHGIGFKEAFEMLGGTYEKPSGYASKLAIYRAQKAQEMKQKEAQKERERRKLNNDLIDIYRDYMERSEPLSDVWCDCYNALQYQLYIGGYLEE